MLKNPNYLYGPCDVYVPMKINFAEFVLNKLMEHRDKIAISAILMMLPVPGSPLDTMNRPTWPVGHYEFLISQKMLKMYANMLGITEQREEWKGNVAYLINENTSASITNEELCQKAVNFAVSLTRLGVRQGDVIGICSDNRLDVWSAVLGVTCAGAVMTPLNMGYTQGELNHVMNISKPAYIISSLSGYETNEETFKSHKFVKHIIIFGKEKPPNTISYEDLIKENVKIDNLEVPEVKGQIDTLFIMYSSGTTGMPKGVMLTHLNVIVTILRPALKESPDFPTPAVIIVTPWFHVFGLMMTFSSLIQGLTLVNLDRFDVELYMKTIEKYKATNIPVVPPMLIALTKSDLKCDLSSIKSIFCGASPLSDRIVPAVKKRFPGLLAIRQGYGMTECTFIISKELNDCKTSKPGSVGPVTSGCVVKIADLETRKPVGPQQKGEICVKSVALMKGYIGRDIKDDLDEEGFYRTGDVGYCDEDGYLYIVDRLKELIKYKAYQVPPAEIEAVLLLHPGVRDVGVVGIPHEASGELPVAFVVVQPGTNVSAEELIQFVAERLSNPKHLRGGVRFVTEIPKNPSGKILRNQLRALVNEENK